MFEHGVVCSGELRRMRRRSLAGLAGLLGIAACLATIAPPVPVLLWNASASMPVGLYRISSPGDADIGDVVVAELPQAARMLAAYRGYLPAGVPAIKRIAAGSGHRVCGRGGEVFVDGRRAAARLSKDGAGRPLGAWQGCRTLVDEILLLGDDPHSFDGRYFGPIDKRLVIGSARLLWAL